MALGLIDNGRKLDFLKGRVSFYMWNVLLLNLATFDLLKYFLLYRDALQKFFYPFDYQEIQVTKPLVPGQRRVHTGLDVKFDFECDSTLDILFSKNRVSLH